MPNSQQGVILFLYRKLAELINTLFTETPQLKTSGCY